MSNENRRQRGEEKIREVYAGDVAVPPEGYAFTDIMLETLFAEVWTRDTLSMRDKRILLLGMIAAQGEAMTFKIQTKAGSRTASSALKTSASCTCLSPSTAATPVPPPCSGPWKKV